MTSFSTAFSTLSHGEPKGQFSYFSEKLVHLCHDKYQRESDTLPQSPLHSSISTEVRYLALLFLFSCVSPSAIPSFPTDLCSHHFCISNLWPALDVVRASHDVEESTSPMFFPSEPASQCPVVSFVLRFIEGLATQFSIRRIFPHLYKMMTP